MTFDISKLDEPIPREKVSQREAAGGRKLDYLEGWYVIHKLNQTLGQGNWSYEAIKIEKTYETKIEKNGKTARGLSYLATVKLTASICDKIVSFVDVGAGKGIDYGMGTDADESAAKEAVTDGVKRCAKNLGMSFGLALYDKSQEFVADKMAGKDKISSHDIKSYGEYQLEAGKYKGQYLPAIDIKELDRYLPILDKGIDNKDPIIMANLQRFLNTRDKIVSYMAEIEFNNERNN